MALVTAVRSISLYAVLLSRWDNRKVASLDAFLQVASGRCNHLDFSYHYTDDGVVGLEPWFGQPPVRFINRRTSAVWCQL